MTCPNKDEVFYHYCKKYALIRGFPEHADDFASEAWIMEKRWPGVTMKNAWANYCRGVLGVRGGVRARIQNAIRFRKVTYGEDAEDFLETRIGRAMEEKRVPTPYLNSTEQLVRIALEEGFEIRELSTIFNRSDWEMNVILNGIRQKILKVEGGVSETNPKAQKVIREQKQKQILQKKKRVERLPLELKDIQALFENA